MRLYNSPSNMLQVGAYTERGAAPPGTARRAASASISWAAAALVGFAAISAPTTASAQAVSEQETREIAREAYIYFYPLITLDVTRLQLTNMAPDSGIGGPMNSFANIRAFPTADLRVVVRPNFDTLYSSGWLDLTKEPMIVSAPDTGGRYYMLPMLDMWSNVFAVPGKRTTGTQAGNFAVVPPGWSGRLPDGVERISAPTPYVWIIGRTQTNGPSDYAAVHKVQDGYKITPLSQWGKAPGAARAIIDPAVDSKTPPLDQVNNMPAARYFAYAAELMKANPPHITDQPIVARMKRIGIEVGKSFDVSKVSPTVKSALDAAPADGLRLMKEKLPTLALAENGWQMNTTTMGVYGTYYLKRAIVAMVGLGANLPEDAVYPLAISDSEGKALDGAGKYVLHFDKDQLPPANAFWSVTMYDKDGFQVANPLNRFALGDRDALKYNADGSLDLYIQRDNPGADKEQNWLPAASGPLGITMRLYAPKPQVLEGRWVPPAIRRLS
jgi:hypothetical protein